MQGPEVALHHDIHGQTVGHQALQILFVADPKPQRVPQFELEGQFLVKNPQ